VNPASSIAIDHVFVMCSAGAPEGAALIRAGLTEGSSNTHPGQGTANRRFFFDNAFLELVWVSDADEARSALVAPTRLWERWAERGGRACPFGLIFRAVNEAADPPFPTWSYHPAYSPAAIELAKGTPLDEPELFYFRFPRTPGALKTEPRRHALHLRILTGVRIGLPGKGPRSDAAHAVQATGLVTFVPAEGHLMTLAFDDETQGRSLDLRPELPLVLSW
jgi:Glyoxalase-like domain